MVLQIIQTQLLYNMFNIIKLVSGSTSAFCTTFCLYPLQVGSFFS